MAISPTIIMIFGGAGDLTWRKLIPSLFDLHRDGRMPKKFAIIAVDRVPYERRRAAQALSRRREAFFAEEGTTNGSHWNAFARHVTYHQGDFKDPATYATLEDEMREAGCGCGSRRPVTSSTWPFRR